MNSGVSLIKIFSLRVEMFFLIYTCQMAFYRQFQDVVFYPQTMSEMGVFQDVSFSSVPIFLFALCPFPRLSDS